MDGKAADVSSRKDNGVHHVRVGGDGQSAPGGWNQGAVVHLEQEIVAKGLNEEIPHQFVGGAPPAALIKLYGFRFHGFLQLLPVTDPFGVGAVVSHSSAVG